MIVARQRISSVPLDGISPVSVWSSVFSIVTEEQAASMTASTSDIITIKILFIIFTRSFCIFLARCADKRSLRERKTRFYAVLTVKT